MRDTDEIRADRGHLASTLRCGDEPSATPISNALPSAFGCDADQRIFVGSEADGAIYGAGVVAGWPSGARCHTADYSGNGKSLTEATLATTISSMNNDANKITCSKCEKKVTPTKLGLVRRHQDPETGYDCVGSECFSQEWLTS
jgi:hypothetical protein